jgi:hypothetical protein
MQDLLCGQDFYAIKVDDLTQNIFFIIGVQVIRKCVKDFLLSFAMVGSHVKGNN